MGAPLPPIGSPSLSRMATCGSKIAPAALPTPSVLRTVASTDAGNGGSWSSSVSTVSREVTTASMPSFDSVKMRSNERSIVSVRT